nr:tetrahydromethanopterin S-methyltransferase subunit A [Candidatus Njordarchaeota archaeon]
MSSATGIPKVKPPAAYPPEEGRYIRGDDYSPVAVSAILDTFDSSIPVELSEILKVAIDSGAALAGSVQTENIGIEKLIANIVANPNIRYLIICWRESRGHLPADAMMRLLKNGVDERRRIIGAEAPTPFLYNLPLGAIERFREQIRAVNLISEDEPWLGMDAKYVRAAVLACRSKEPVEFRGYILHDEGAYPKPAICSKITVRIKEPWKYQTTSEEADLIEQIKKAAKERGARKQ